VSQLGREKSRQAQGLLPEDSLWLFLTREGSDPASQLVFDAAVSGNAAFMLHPRAGALALVANYDEGHVARLGVFDEIRAYERSFGDALGAWLRELTPTRLLLNYSESDHLSDGLTHGQFLRIEKLAGEALPGAALEPSEAMLARVRGVKTAEELARLERAVRGSNALYERLRPRLRVGQSEREVQGIMLDIARELGFAPHLGDYGGPLVCINRVGLAHRAPGDDRIEGGDLLILDHALGHEGYHSDLARTLYFRREGETAAPADALAAFASAHAAITAAFGALRPGALGWQVDEVARQVHLDNGYPEISHATGHQLGRHVHDGGTILGPRWERYGDAPYGALEPGNVFTLEPTILQSPKPSMLVEENVVITETGARWLSVRQDELWVV
jgi:Xaa-Pro aminopeptidase